MAPFDPLLRTPTDDRTKMVEKLIWKQGYIMTRSNIHTLAILISGGWSDSGHRSVEALRSDGTPLCKLADLPDNRRVHTMDGPISCGGARTMTTCLIYEKAE